MNKNSIVSLQKEYSHKSKEFDEKLLKIPLQDTLQKFSFVPDLAEAASVNLLFVDPKTAFLRKPVSESLLQAAESFSQQGLTLKLESAYRTLDEQRQKFVTRYKSVRKNYPKYTKTKALKKANIYTAGVPILAAHTAGAAVDVTLLDKNGQLLDFGVPYNYGDIESITDYPHLSKKVKENRKLLKEGMEKYGFINYPFEYWHYSIGDVCAAYLGGQDTAVFGPVEFDSQSHNLTTPIKGKQLREFFNV